MAYNDKLGLKGEIELKVRNREGEVIDSRKKTNLVVNVGKQALASWLAQSSPSGYFMKYVEVGTGTSQPQATDTALQSPLSPRVSGTVSSDGMIVTIVALFDYEVCSGALTEVGLFNASTGGTMFARSVFPVINKSDDMALEVTWRITIS